MYFYIFLFESKCLNGISLNDNNEDDFVSSRTFISLCSLRIRRHISGFIVDIIYGVDNSAGQRLQRKLIQLIFFLNVYSF